MQADAVTFGSVLIAFLALMALGVLLAGFFMYVGAKLAMVEKSTFGRSVLAAVGSSIADWSLTAALSPIPLLGSCSGFLIGLAASLVVIKLVFDTTMGKAFLVWVFHLLAQIVALLFALFLFSGVLLSYSTLPASTR
ncbi:MAG: hypothetical protein Kow0099_05830 [Candidatus Abyssubacteria bacterium]